jgi:hypothetical protein
MSIEMNLSEQGWLATDNGIRTFYTSEKTNTTYLVGEDRIIIIPTNIDNPDSFEPIAKDALLCGATEHIISADLLK